MKLYKNHKNISDAFWAARTNPHRIAKRLSVIPGSMYNVLYGRTVSEYISRELEKVLDAPYWIIWRAYSNKSDKPFIFSSKDFIRELTTCAKRTRNTRVGLLRYLQGLVNDPKAKERYRVALEDYFRLPINLIIRLAEGESVDEILTEYLLSTNSHDKPKTKPAQVAV